ncbi:flavin reductase [Amylibacter marinus]|uniref:Flavin reductase n=1 Tax=Amylibacter marinus TaxID=1475483 RepID=A0ABQ5VUP6_9RHOB|nr:flavin reductase family protein [Amylibacter marinus]GLQ34907.1 flavin reductase [Amylibacter marinus]
MFYKPENGHGLPHDPFKAIVAPRPIAWVSTRDAQGRDNLAPYSFFNGISDTPPIVGFSSGAAKLDGTAPKDSARNIHETGVFCISIVPEHLQDAMNISSGNYPADQDEFALAGLEKSQAQTIDAAYVTDAPATLECRLFQAVPLPGGYEWIMGMVTAVHIQDRYLVDGLLDVTLYRPLARLGYRDYAAVGEIFQLTRPST